MANLFLQCSNSDHCVVSCHFTHQLVSFCKRNNRTVWIYSKANFTRASELITDTNWDALIGDCIDTSWTNWKLKFLDIMTKTVPHKTISVRQNIPWLNLAILKKIRKRNSLCHKARVSGCCRSWRRYKAL